MNGNKELGKNNSKVSRHTAIDALVSGIKAVNADTSLKTGQKSVAYKRLASKFLTAMYDRRKPNEKRIKPNTLKRYLTDARNAVTSEQWFHHSFDAEMAKLIKDFPLYNSELIALRDAGADSEKPLDAVRVARKAFDEKLVAAINLVPRISNIDVSAIGWKKEVNEIAKEDQAVLWADELKQLVKAKDSKSTIDTLVKKLNGAADDKFYGRIKGLKVDHEIMRHLIQKEVFKRSNAENSQQAVAKKHTSVKTLDYREYMSTVHALLDVKSWVPDYWEALTIGLIMVTGRRPVEVLTQGRFKKTGEYTLEFSGQAKQRGGVDHSKKYEIYSLVPAGKVIDALERLRSSGKGVMLAGVKPDTNTSANQRVSNMTNGNLNKFVDNLIKKNNWPDMSAKHGRALYAKICVSLFHRTDPRWEGYIEDKMVSELLAHDDADAQKFYRDWHIDNAGDDFALVEYEPRGTILEELDKLDDVMFKADNEKANGARATLHGKVKQALRDDSDLRITNRYIRDNLGSSPHTIKNYLELAEPALLNKFDLVQFIGQQIKRDDGQIVKNEVAAALPDKTNKKEEKPHFAFEDKGDGDWVVTITERGLLEEYMVKAGSRLEAGKKAWDEHNHVPEQVTSYHVEFHFKKGALIPVVQIDVEANSIEESKRKGTTQIRAGGIKDQIHKVVAREKRN